MERRSILTLPLNSTRYSRAMLTHYEERKLFYRECVAVLVIELLNAFGEDDQTLDSWLYLPADQDRDGVKKEVDRFRRVMEDIEKECSAKREEATQTAA